MNNEETTSSATSKGAKAGAKLFGFDLNAQVDKNTSFDKTTQPVIFQNCNGVTINFYNKEDDSAKIASNERITREAVSQISKVLEAATNNELKTAALEGQIRNLQNEVKVKEEELIIARKKPVKRSYNRKPTKKKK